MHCERIIFSIDPSFFYATAVTKNHSKDQQRNEANNGTDIIYWTVLPARF